MSEEAEEQTTPLSLSVIGVEDVEERGIFERRIIRAEIDANELRDRVHAFLGAMEHVIGGVMTTVGRYRLETVSVTAEVSAKGKVSLLGAGGEVAGKGGLTFSFKLSDASTQSS
jgi:hypothetical protein